MNTLWRKTWRDLWLYRARTALVVAAIAVGVAATGVATTSLIVLRRDLRDGYAATNPAHAILDVSAMDEALAAEVAALPGVAAAEARRQTAARLVLADGETRPLTLYTWPDFAGAAVGMLKPAGEQGEEAQGSRGAGEQGGLLSPLLPSTPAPLLSCPPEGALWLERSAAPALGLAVGEVVTVQMSDGDTFSLPVAGFVNDLAVAPTTVQPGVSAYMSDATAARLGLPAGYNQLALRVGGTSSSASGGVAELEAPPTRADVERTLTAVTEWLADEGVTVLRANVPEPGVHLMQGSVDTGLLMIGILGGMTLLLSAFLVINVMSAVVAQQVRVIGVLKAMGGGRRLVLAHYARMVLLMGGMALLLAVPLGLGGAWFMSSFLAGELNFDIPSFGLTWQTLAVQAAGALLLPLLAALGPLWGAARLTVREALDESAGVQGSRGAGVKEDTPALFLSPAPLHPRTPALLAWRNIGRRRLRLGLTVAALALAGAMFIATFGLRRGLDEAIEILVGEFGYDVQLDFAGSYPAQRLLREAAGLDGIERVEAWGVADARRVYDDGRVGSSFTLFGVPPTTQIATFAEREGEWLTTNDERRTTNEEEEGASGSSFVIRRSSFVVPLYISYETAKLIGRPPLDEALALRLDGGPERSLRLVGVSQRPFDATAFMPYADFERATGQRGRAGRLVVYLEGVTSEEGGAALPCAPAPLHPCSPAPSSAAQQAAVAAELTARFEAAGMPVLRAETAASFRAGYRAQFNNLVVLLMALAGLTALVGGLGLANTMALNVLERSREIGVLRAMGAGRGLLQRLVLAEGLAVALLSGLLAMLLAVPLTLALDRVMGHSLLGSPLSFAFAPGAALGWLGLALVIGVVACWVPAVRASRMTVREAVAYE